MVRASSGLDCLAFCLALVIGDVCSCQRASADVDAQTSQEASNLQSGDEADPDYNGQDFTRPENSVSTRLEFKSSGTTSQTDRERFMLQDNAKFDLGPGWKAGLVVQVPLIDKTTQSSNSSDSSHEAGLGDATFQAALLHEIDRSWAFGFGARLVAPAAPVSLGSDTWQIMPGLGLRYSFLDINSEIYFVPVIRYAQSVPSHSGARNISEPQIAPTLNIGLPDRWFVTFYPSHDIRINYGTPVTGQKGRLFLPCDMAIGRKVTDDVVASLEVSAPIVNDYPVYKFKTELKLTWQF